MLRVFHNKKVARIMWIVLLAIIGPAFIFWGFGSYQRQAGSAKDEDFGKVFGRKVSRDQYVQALKASQVLLKMQLGEAYNDMLKYIDLKSLTMQRLVLLTEARRRGLRVSDQEVVSMIEKDPSFSRNGVFNKELYDSAITYYLRMTPREYEEQMRQTLLIRKLSTVVTAGTGVTDDEIREAYRKEHEQLNLDYVSAIPGDFASGIKVTDEEARTWFAGHSLDFKQPLSFDLEYVVTDKEPQVTAIHARLDKEPLEKIAADMGLPLKQTGLFTQADPIPGIGWSQELITAVTEARPGQVLPPLEMEKKYYICRLKERKEPYVPGFDAIKDKVTAAMTKERARALAKEKIEAFARKLGETPGADSAKLASDAGLKTGNTGLFKFGSYLEGIGASDAFYNAGSSLAEGKYSDVIEIPSGFFIVKLKAKEGVDEAKFAQNKETVKEKLLSQKREQAFGKFSQDLMKRALQ